MIYTEKNLLVEKSLSGWELFYYQNSSNNWTLNCTLSHLTTVNSPYTPYRLWNYTALLLPPFVFRNVLGEFPLLFCVYLYTAVLWTVIQKKQPPTTYITLHKHWCISSSLPIAIGKVCAKLFSFWMDVISCMK